MGETKQTQYTLYLAPEVAEKFDALVARSRIPKSELFREAVDDLLSKHGVSRSARRKAAKPK